MNMKGIFPRVKTYLDIACFHNSRVMDIKSIFIIPTLNSLVESYVSSRIRFSSLEKHVVAWLKLFADTLFRILYIVLLSEDCTRA